MLRAIDDQPCNGVLGLLLHRRGKRKGVGLCVAGDHLNSVDAKPGERESACLVEDDALQAAEVFDHRAALDEDASADEEADPRGDGGRRGQHHAQGQATTSTATLRETSRVNQNVIAAAASTAGTK